MADFQKESHQDFLLYEESRRGRKQLSRAHRIDMIRQEKRAEAIHRHYPERFSKQALDKCKAELQQARDELAEEERAMKGGSKLKALEDKPVL